MRGAQPPIGSIRTGEALRRHVLTSSAFVITGQGLTIIAGLGINALLARSLTPGELADYFLIITVVTLLATIGRVGSGQAIVKLAAEALGRGDQDAARCSILSGARLAATSTAVFCALLLSPAGSWLAEDILEIEVWSSVAWLAALWVWFQSTNVVVSESFRSLQQIHLATVFGGTARSLGLLGLLAGYVLTTVDGSVRTVLMLSLIVAVVAAVTGWAMLNSHLPPRQHRQSVPPMTVIDIGWPVMFNSVVVFMMVRANLWVLGASADRDAVALYGAVLQLVLLVTTPLLLLNAIITPLIAERYPDPTRRASLERMLRALTAVVSIPSTILVLVFVGFGSTILDLVYGDFYREGALALGILAIGQCTNVFTGPSASLLTMTGHQRSLLTTSLVFGVLSVTGAAVFASRFGVNAAAAAACAAIVGQNITLVVIARRKTGILTVVEHAPGRLRAEVRAVRALRSERPTSH